MPLTTGVKKPNAAHVDHIIPRAKGGDDSPGNLRATCKRCNESRHRRRDNRFGPDGWQVYNPFGNPADKQWSYSIPHGVQPSEIPVVLVCGPPASGKTTYVSERAADGDLVIDMDDLRERVGGAKWSRDKDAVAFEYRDDLIHSLAIRRTGVCWLIVSAPTPDERREWLRALGRKATCVVMDTPLSVCRERIESDPRRPKEQIEALDAWRAPKKRREGVV